MSIEIITDVEQNTPAWLELRRGLITASELHHLVAKSKKGEPLAGRENYLDDLAAERLGAEPAESFTNAHMERGHLLEDRARQDYALITDEEPETVGFVRNLEFMWGCSPDGLICGRRGGLEIKTKLPRLQLRALRAGAVPAEHVAQIQGQMMIAELEFVDFVSYWPGLRPLIKRVPRDEPFIAMLRSEVARFNAEVDAAVEFERRYGQPAREAA